MATTRAERMTPSLIEPTQLKHARVASVALLRPIDTPYSFSISDEFAEAVRPGMRVTVPFGRGRQAHARVCPFGQQRGMGLHPEAGHWLDRRGAASFRADDRLGPLDGGLLCVAARPHTGSDGAVFREAKSRRKTGSIYRRVPAGRIASGGRRHEAKKTIGQTGRRLAGTVRIDIAGSCRRYRCKGRLHIGRHSNDGKAGIASDRNEAGICHDDSAQASPGTDI
ncbi:MAG: hypothetical protein IPK83_01370 [Planctomycetes bacterium]|nr:hypothetical protein [Planctomycetota bacterium]